MSNHFKGMNSTKATAFAVSFLLFSHASIGLAEEPAACVTEGVKEVAQGKGKKDVTPADNADLVAFQNGVPVIDGGVKPWSEGPVRNQCNEEICWSYTLNEFADRGGKDISSPEHNGFWHLYFQFYKHNQYFDELRKRIKSGDISKEDAIKEANLMIRLRKGSKTAREKGFVKPVSASQGSDETTALTEAPDVGFVPASLFDHQLKTAKQATDFQTQLDKVLNTFLSDTTTLDKTDSDKYTKVEKDGINDNIYDLMTTHLQEFYGGSAGHKPYRPGDTFTVGSGENKETHTPLTYMNKVLKFDPARYKEINLSTAVVPLGLKAVHASLTDPHNPEAVPIGFAIWDQKLAEKLGVFSKSTLQGPLVGGHEIMIVNELKASEKDPTTVGHVDQNSWATNTGLTIDGKPPENKKDGGYYGMTPENIEGAAEQGEPASITLSLDILKQEEFKLLR